MEENFLSQLSFYAYQRLRRVLARALTSFPAPACCRHVRTEEYIIFASCLNIFLELVRFMEQQA